MSKTRSRRSAAVKDKWRNKTWYEVHAPSYFENVEIAISPSMDEKSIIGRVFETTLYDITDDFTKSHITLKFQVNEVKGDKAYTIFKGHEITRDYLRSMVRRGTSRINGIFTVTTQDGYRLRLTTVVFTFSRGKTSQQKTMRKMMADTITEYAKELTFEQFIDEEVNGGLSEKIVEVVKKIMPVRRVELVKSRLTSIPKTK